MSAVATLHQPRLLPTGGLSVCVSEDVVRLRADWLALERTALASPYQRFDFIVAWLTHAAEAANVVPRVGLVRDGDGALVAILPFGLRRGSLTRIGVYLGGSHVNFGLPLIDRTVLDRLTPDAVAAILSDYCAASGLDALHLVNQPETWAGRAHPFAGIGLSQAAPSDGFVADLGSDYAAFQASRLSKERGQKFVRKRTRLIEAGVGFPAETLATTSQSDLIDVFLAQKAGQFARMGVADPFAEPGVAAFLKAATEALPGGDAALEMRALIQDGQPIAILGGIPSADAYSLLLMSYDAASPLTRYSPGEVLLADTMREMQERGVRCFDFGVGEALYKSVWSTERVALFDSFIAGTARGHAAIGVLRATRNAKRWIKRHPRWLALARRVQMSLKRRPASSAEEPGDQVP
ncbi:MAG: GNAT family N-acetyltransferase [Labrys sp. (in: a-proteobacteria)]|jgi:CelD/BcsL family acetyltransferase involved in cellulose biosynthesis